VAVYQRILLAVDLSTDSLLIGQRARTLAAALDAELEMIHVIEPAPPVVAIPPEPVMPVIVTTQAELTEIAQAQIGRLARELGVPETHWRVVVGDIKREIVRTATDGQMDLIAIGSRGRHALAFLLKPTEDVVVRRAPCDVLAVRLPEENTKPTQKSRREEALPLLAMDCDNARQ
jgi:universal stress protein A